MDIIKIINIILILSLLVLGIETFIYVNRVEKKKSDIEPLITRVKIIMFLTILLSIVTIINILVNR